MIIRESVQQVIDHTDIVEVIGQFVNLKRRGANYIANCPFHNEKTPSFNVNPAKGIFKCFGCGKGGDAVTFIEEYEKFSFTEAIRWLANYYHIELQETEVSEEFKESKQVEESLRIINDFAAQYFHDNLHDNAEGEIVGGQYFKERGFSPEIIEEFKLGYSLDSWDAFSSKAIKNGFTQELLEKSGLIKSRDGKPYDNYKGRVIFPIFSNTGKILGFGARILKKNDHAPKYINSPENELYVKNKVLYGLYQSRKAIGDSKECLLVEGYTDVISLHQGGVKNVVSSSGTSLTEGQLKLIGNLTKNLIILYDGDAAGIKAALRGMDMALADSFRVQLVLLPEGHDPDSFIKEKGAEDFKDYIAQNKRDFIEFVLETGLKDVGNDPVKKSKLVNDIAETISKINKTEDFSIQQHYIRKSAADLEVEEEGMVNLVNKFIREQVNLEQRKNKRDEQKNEEPDVIELTDTKEEVVTDFLVKDNKEEWQLIKLLLEYGPKPYGENTVAYYFFETIDLELFQNPLAKKIAEVYYNYWEEHKQIPELNFFVNNEDKNIRQKAADLLTEAFTPSEDWQKRYKIEVLFGEDLYEEEIASTFAYFELKLVKQLLQENWKQIKTEQDQNQVELLMKTHLKLKERERGLLKIVFVR